MLRAGLWVLAVGVVLIAMAGGLLFGLFHTFNPAPPPSNFPKPATALQSQQQDIEQFSRLIAMDRSFSPAARAEADRQIAALKAVLRQVNESLWSIEDQIRDYEARQVFDAEFVRLARAVYRNNDERGRLKRRINELLGSAIVEEKQYTNY